MATNIDSLKRLIDNIRSIGFWRRLFGWSMVTDQLIGAAEDLQSMVSARDNAAEQLQNQRQQLADLNKDLSIARDQATRLREQLSIVELKEAQRQSDQNKLTATLKSIQDKILADREAEERQAHAGKIAYLENLRFTWSNHELSVQQTIKALCQKHTIEYVPKAPFKGDPDNTIKIAGEYIILDAKSPRGDDLSNFPNYLKEQAEKVRKYTGEDAVKKWVFFVIPENTLSNINRFVYHLADYQVFIIAANSLEPILLSLQKVEEYEFAEQLSPEDRENICRILGKFAHLSKRRIQIDTFFIGQFMELARKCENDLPPEILNEAIEFEKAEKLNPPIEKRAKAIAMAELERAAGKAVADAVKQGILPAGDQITSGLNSIPLYNA